MEKVFIVHLWLWWHTISRPCRLMKTSSMQSKCPDPHNFKEPKKSGQTIYIETSIFYYCISKVCASGHVMFSKTIQYKNYASQLGELPQTRPELELVAPLFIICSFIFYYKEVYLVGNFIIDLPNYIDNFYLYYN